MKSINVSKLKANLSRYLRMASRGTRIVVTDRDDPIAQIVPLDSGVLPWHEQLARSGRVRLGSQHFDRLRFTKLRRKVAIQRSLQAVREEPHEVRRR